MWSVPNGSTIGYLQRAFLGPDSKKTQGNGFTVASPSPDSNNGGFTRPLAVTNTGTNSVQQQNQNASLGYAKALLLARSNDNMNFGGVPQGSNMLGGSIASGVQSAAATANKNNNTATASATSADSAGKAAELMTQLDKILSGGFSYDFHNDPSYLAAVQQAQEGAKTASRNTLETMNDRGIVNSSITSSQIDQIEQKAQQAPLQLVPQLESNAYNRYQDTIRNTSDLMKTYLGQANWEKSFNADQSWKEADATGTYESPEAMKLINEVIGYKQAYGSASPEDKKIIAAKAVTARAALAGMNIDADKWFGANVGLDQAYKNVGNSGIQTMASKRYAIDDQRYTDEQKTQNDHWDKDYKLRQNADSRANNTTSGPTSQQLSNNADMMIFQMQKEGVKSLDDAIGWMTKHEAEVMSGKVDPGTIMNYFKGAKSGTSTVTAKTPYEIQSDALSKAKDDPAWKDADTPEKKNEIINFYKDQLTQSNKSPEQLQADADAADQKKIQDFINHHVQWMDRLQEPASKKKSSSAVSDGAYNNYYRTAGASKANPTGYKVATNAVIKAANTLGLPVNQWITPTMELLARESEYYSDPVKSKNPKSSAQGLFQFLNSTRKNYGWKGIDWNNPDDQALAGLRYIKDRYGDPVKALKFWDEQKAKGNAYY
jgi:hypothetical protein